MAGGMSGPPGRARRMAARLAPPTRITASPEAIPIRMALPAERAASGIIDRVSPSGHAERALGGLVDGVRASRRPIDDGRRVHSHGCAADDHLEPGQALRRGSQLVLAGVV